MKAKKSTLKTSEARYRRLFEAAQDGILILDADTGGIDDVNPFLIEMLGFFREEILGKKLWEIGVFVDTDKSKTAFQELQTKKYIRYEDLPLKTKDGRLIDVEFVSNVYLVNNKKVIQCNIRDITMRKRAEAILKRDKEDFERLVEEKTRELIDAHVELDKANRLSDIGLLSATVAHELRNPLAAIKMAAHNKIFEPFFTTKAKGTGLGLFVCQQIVNMHEGDIGIKSGLVRGTSVILRLPKKE